MTYFLGDSNRHPQSIEGKKIEQQTHYNRDTTLKVMTYLLGDSNRQQRYYLESNDLPPG